jgi:hypothetical protein
MLVLAGHTAGVEQGYLLKDDNPPDSMKLEGLKQVLQRVQAADGLNLTLDILGFDSCLMSMAEICYELKGLVKVIIGSQSLAPNPGWPFKEVLEVLTKAEGKLKPPDFAREIVREYVNFYLEHAINSGLSVDLSALDVDASVGVAQAVNKLATAISDRPPGDVLTKPLIDEDTFRKALILAHWEAQSYNGELFVDLYDFCELLVKHYSESALTLEYDKVDATTDIARMSNEARLAVKRISDACDEVKAAISEMVLGSCFCGVDHQYSNGISIYFPWSEIFTYYRPLAFAQKEAANWFSFLETYVEKTRRPPRGDERGSESHGITKEVIDSRRQPPAAAGPSDPVHSMRNPPRKWSEHGIPGCIKDKEEDLRKVFQLLP